MKDDPDYNWRRDAPCVGKRSDLWFPPTDKIGRLSYSDIGVLVCERCPLWDKCLQDGMEEAWGIWGGLTPKERAGVGQRSGRLAEHGTFVRYRQGCKCSECYEAETSDKPYININAIPFHGEPLPKPEDLLQRIMEFGW